VTMGAIGSNSWFLGIDMGTGSCKSVVIDENVRILGFGVGDYSSSGVQTRWREQDPDAMLEGMIRSAKAAISQSGVDGKGCAGVSLGSALHGILAVDKSDNPLTGVITWADDRASLQARKVKETFDTRSLYQQTGCPSHWMYPLYKLIWLREIRPEIFHKARRFISAKEFVVKRLVGDYAVDYSLAAGSGLLNAHTLTWNEDALNLIGIGAERLSELCRPFETFHGINPDLAGAIGISPNTPFVMGSSDAANSNLGAGAIHEWQSTCMIGTSGAFRIISSKPILDKRARSWCYVIDETRWLVGGAINNGGVALSWLQNMLNLRLPALSEPTELSFDDLVQMASQVDAGAQGVVCLPFFAGERSPNWNLNARAMFFGLTLLHDARHMARALLEGVAFRMRSISDVLCEISGDIRQIRASGGFTHSPVWVQIVADALGREMVVPEYGETSSLGAAFWAMLGTGALPSIGRIGELVKLAETYRPNRDNAAIYDKEFEIYNRLYDAVSPCFDALSELHKS